MLSDPNADFDAIQQSFYAEFGEEIGPKGSGWKQFKRWEYYQEQRLDADGKMQEPGKVLEEMLKYYESHPKPKNYLAGSGNWELLGPALVPNNGTGQLNGNGRLTCITFHPTDTNIIYVGAPAGGVWKTEDKGASWTKFITGFTRLGISSIVIHPTNTDTLYVATGDRDGNDAPGYGVWRSTNGGLTWAPRNNGMGNRTINELLMDPNDPNIMVAAASNQRIYRTTDGGANWVASASLGTNPKDIDYHPANANIVYASGTEFHRSADGGITWTQITSGVPTGVQRIAMAVSPNEPDWVYLLAGNGNGLVGVYRSTNSGINFTTRATSPNILGYPINGSDNNSQAWYDLVIAADPTDANIIYTGGINIWKSIDGGSTMTCSSYWVGPSGGVDGVHADQHALKFSPHNNDLYNGNDGGIYFTTDEGANWTDISDGLAIAQIYKIGISQQTFDRSINGYQDNGTAIGNGTNFITEIGGDGFESIIDPTDDTYMYGALYYGDIRRSTNGGNTFSSIANSIPETGAWVTPYKLDPNDANRMFAGFDNVWRNDAVRTGTTWTQISSFSNTSDLVDIAIAPSNSNVMYVSKGGASNFYNTTDALAASPTWTDLDANLPAGGTPRDIEIDPTDPTHLFIALGDNIYESNNSGSTWTDISGTLPNISLNTIVIDRDSPNEAMYVGMDAGVYYLDNTLSDWTLFNSGIPNVEVTELEIHYNGTECKSTLYASTYGQGLWKSDLKDPGNVMPVACFEASATDVCIGETVILKDNSSYTPNSWTWTITPATFTYVGSTNANSQNPEVRFAAAGNYTIALVTTNSMGADTETKTSYIDVSISDIATSFNTDFEAEALCGTASNCAATNCALASPYWINLTNGADDDIDWRIDEGGTPSGGTGPTIDFNPGNSEGNYAYIEASSCSNNTAILESSCMNLDQDYDFVIGYHMSGTDMADLHFDIRINGNWVLDMVPPISGDQGTSWQTQTISLMPYTGEIVKLRIRASTGNGFRSDIALDDISFMPASTLPITLLSFDATLQGNSAVQLDWTTATQLNTDYFEIERSSDAIHWEVVHREKGAGTSNEVLDYQAWDAEPLYGVSYYRLKDVDFDGSFSYSDIRYISLNSVSKSIYPNPANDFLFIPRNEPAQQEVIISNLVGQVLIRQSFQDEESKMTVDVSVLPIGVYFVSILSAYGAEEVYKVVVER